VLSLSAISLVDYCSPPLASMQKTRSPAVARVGRLYRLYPMAIVRDRKKTISQIDYRLQYSTLYSDAAISNARLQ